MRFVMISAFALTACLSQPVLAQKQADATEGSKPANPEDPPKVDLGELLESLKGLPDLKLPPPQPEYDPTKPVVGFGIASTAAGAKINVIVPNSAAERAGLEVGSTILSINNIWLAGFKTEEVVKMIGAAKGPIAFYLDNGQTVTLTKAPIPQSAE